ncbi:MAG: NAD(P)H-binding protein [Pseudoxanthomonas sp.]
MTRNRNALVLGASGGIGGEVARQLLGDGWQVRALKRGQLDAVREADGITWLAGDALDRDAVMGAAQGCSVIVHAVNPPGYRDWDKLVLPMLDNTIAAATAGGATIVLPGTVYNYGPDAGPSLAENALQQPVTRKGAIRVQLEQRLHTASQRGARVIIVRAGDFFGPKAGNSWFSQGLVKPGRPIRRIRYPGAPGIGHQWAYLPDVARTMVELLACRDTLDAFASFHMGGHWDGDGTQMTAAIARIVRRRTGRTPRTAGFPWWLLTLASPWVTTFREMREMRYLWQRPLRLDNAALRCTLGHEPHTPLDDAIEATLVGLGNLSWQAGAMAGQGGSLA